MSFSIVSALRWWAKETPDTMALSVDDRAVSYKELHQWAQGAALELQALGICAGDRIAIISPQSLEYCALALGMQFIGAIAVPMSVRFTAHELRIAVEDMKPKIIFASSDCRDLARQLLDYFPGLVLRPLEGVADLKHARGASMSDNTKRDDPVAVVSTSGSTAKPKFVIFTHDMVVSIACELAVMEPACRQGAKVYLCSPFSSGGLYCFFEYLVLGCSQFLDGKFDAARVLDLLVRERITIFPAATVHFERISVLEEFADADLSSIRWATIGGSRVPISLVTAWRDKGVMLRPLFGQTEAGGAWAARGVALSDPKKCGYGGIFTEFRTVDEAGKFLGPGEIGQIVIRGPSIMAGYWENADATSQTIKDDWLFTGDLGVLDEDGSLTFVDRIKDIIISGSLNISAAEVERVISEVEGVAEVAVIAAADKAFGETPLAVVHGNGDLSIEMIISHCNTHLAAYKIPRYIALEGEPLPRLVSGKISKPILRERYRDASNRLQRVR
jgi:fatty-acyl-CoA synthase